ncbi:hypothetical protein PV10_00408 [Exophiala mesophila]|uniref:Zn(2)-C6 fungal-type domain-containing protein n=1 Tax=Exophiala mesophila TaxID=212818 RepID=A0A0D1ZRK4_EXOME|nr:uncharacterized protein PV10_00408 [Exophiala mesophila]KIV96559.1 hypothetical protein PV10_00408 [Exophiala mesophila]
MTEDTAIQAPMEPRRACQECNRKKTKCDMRRPKCGLCARTGSACSFPSKRKRPTPRKPQLKSQSRDIKDGVSRLLQLLHTATQQDAGTSMSPTQREAAQSLLQDSLKGLLTDILPSNGDDLQHRGDPDHPSQDDQHADDNEYDGLETDEDDDEDQQSSADDVIHDDPGSGPSSASSKPKLQNEITCSLAIDLTQLFFEKIQAWLPLLHRPRFQARFEPSMLVDGDVMRSLAVDDALLLYGMFALSARFSTHPALKNIPPMKRGHIFAERARQMYLKSRSTADHSLIHLQGCIVLTNYFYTSGPTPKGWLLIGECVRLAYELGLSDIDDDMWTPSSPLISIDKEELRRAWWCVWELDTFASSVSRKPFSIDRKRMAVKLPMSDEAWFSGNPVESNELLMTPGQTWRTLEYSSNQDERAWYLVANHLATMIHDRSQQRQEVSIDEKMMLDNEITCFRLALPPTLQLDPELVVFTPETFSKCNWVIGTHLMLMTASYISGAMGAAESDDRSSSAASAAAGLSPLRLKAVELSRIIGLWDSRYIATAHPFFTCMLLPFNVFEFETLRSQQLIATTHNLSKLVLRHVGEKWRLGLVCCEIAKMVERPNNLTDQEKQLAKRYKLFFQGPQVVANSPANSLPRSDRDSRSVEGGDPSSSQHSMSIMHQPVHLPGEYATTMYSADQMPLADYILLDQTGFQNMPFNAYDSQVDLDMGFSDFFGGYPEHKPDFSQMRHP